jgi:hypothetical protein
LGKREGREREERGRSRGSRSRERVIQCSIIRFNGSDLLYPSRHYLLFSTTSQLQHQLGTKPSTQALGHSSANLYQLGHSIWCIFCIIFLSPCSGPSLTLASCFLPWIHSCCLSFSNFLHK